MSETKAQYVVTSPTTGTLSGQNVIAPATLFSYAEAMRARDLAIDASEAGHTQKWREDASKAVERCAREYATFVSDDVWRYLTPRQRKGEARALGAIILKASRSGICHHGGYAKTNRVSSHRATVSLWVSDIFGDALPKTST